MVKIKEFHKDLREVVIEHHKNGKSSSDIYENIAKRASQRSVQRWIKEYDEIGNVIFKYSFFLHGLGTFLLF